MNTPPFLLGTTILFWGGLGGNYLLAIALALLVEAARYVRWRVHLTEAQVMRVADGTTLLMFAVGVAFYLATGFPRAAVVFFEWLPVMLLPVALVQAYGTEREIDLRVLFWSLRRREMPEPRKVNVAYPYLILWVIAASATSGRGPAFDAGLVAILVWALWPLRVKGRNAFAWLALLATACALGYVGGVALHNLQLWLEGAAPEWIAGGGSKVNPYRGSTDIGRLGELKMSDVIVLRVTTAFELKPPLLLHNASYNEYVGVNWFARGGTFSRLPPEAGGRSWKLAEGSPKRTVSIVDPARTGDPVLALPAGSIAIADVDARTLSRNPLGAVQAEAPPGFFGYRVEFDPQDAERTAPSQMELRVPEAERVVIERVAREWGLTGMSPQAAVDTVRRRFLAGYAYSTFQKAPAGSATPLADFLLRTRTGHCEHFASATTLLLRAAGVPARYATGYSVQEWSALEQAWLARERHSHAWTRAFVDGKWIDVDATPPIWFDLEAGERPAWGALGDAWSWARYRVAMLMEGAGVSGRAILVGVPLALVMLFFSRRIARGVRSAVRRPAPGALSVPQDDFRSEFAIVMTHLASLGLARSPVETLREWLARVAPRIPGDRAELARLAALHTRLRFDPAGLSTAERDDLARSSARWIATTGAKAHQG